MLQFILRRLLVTIPMLVASSILTFVLVTSIGVPQAIENAQSRPNPSKAQIESLRRDFGLDKPKLERYVDWVTNFVQGDWGKTPKKIEITTLMWQRAQVTLSLLLFATVLAVLFGVAVGVFSALRQYTVFDYTGTFFAFFLFSIPVNVMAIVLKQFGALQLNPWARRPSISVPVLVALLLAGLLCGFLVMRNRYKFERVQPLNKYVLGAAAGLGIAAAALLVFKIGWDGNVYRRRNPKPLIATVGQSTPGLEGGLWVRLQDKFWHLILPSMTLIFIGFAGYSRFMRASMLDVLSADYVRTARAKGLSERRVTVRHAMRNALLPVVTIVALDFGTLIAGAIITERVFAWNGMGDFFTDALTEKDPRSLLAFVMVTALSVILFNLIADVIYARLDPRIRIG
jgi:ABC-type dipeptide/oligopeptide/nickel transport system permease component